MAKKKDENQVVEIRPLDIQHVGLRIVGTAPLIVHAWSEKAKREMLEKQTGKGKKAKSKDPKNPMGDFAGSLYWLENKPTEDEVKDYTEYEWLEALNNGARFGFPVSGIKQASNSAAFRNGWVPNQMGLRGAFFLHASDGEFAEIKDINTGERCIPEMREDMVRIGKGTADIRYRGEFTGWYMEFDLEYNASGQYSLDDIINCISAGGYMVGIGEWRPEKDGMFGTYKVEVCG